MSTPNNPWQGQYPGGQPVPPGYPPSVPPSAPVPVPPHLAGNYQGMPGVPQPVLNNQPWAGQPQGMPRPVPVAPQHYPNQVAPQPYYPGSPQPTAPYPYPQQGHPQGQQAYYPSQPVPMQHAPVNYAPAHHQQHQPYPGQPVPIQPVPVQPVPVQPTPVYRQPQAVPHTPNYPQPVPIQAAPVTPVTRPVPVVMPAPVPVQNRVAETPNAGVNRQTSSAVPRPLPVPATPTQPNSPTNRPEKVGARPIPVTAASRPIPVTASPDAVVVRATPDDEEEQVDIEAKVVRSAPPWLVSLVVHMVAIIVLALVVFVKAGKNSVSLEVIYAEELGVQLDDSLLDSPKMEMVDVQKPAFALDSVAANDPFAAPPTLPEVSLDGTSASDNIAAPTIGMALTGREKGAKEALLGAYGGTATTEASVRKGLEWLKKNQEAKGTWSLMGPYSGGASYENKVAATAMALLAFQGNGNTHKEGDFKKEVAKGITALLEFQDKDGNFFHDGIPNHRLYSQAQATIAICEIYGMTKDPKYKHPAQLAVDYAVKKQSPEGGWRYYPGQDSDTSVTGWFVIALQSAMMAGLDVPSQTLENISRYLDSVAYENGSKYGYNRSDRGPTLTMTAEALLCRQYLGWARNDERLVRGVDFVNDNLIQWGGDDTSYYWYYATQLTHHMEGPQWNKWNAVMREVIPKNQEKSGKEAGSWPPHEDRWAALAGGRLYQTCLCIYMLEVYYRHLPIYKWKSK